MEKHEGRVTPILESLIYDFSGAPSYLQYPSANNICITNKEGADGTGKPTYCLSVDVPTISPTQDFVFARVGVKVKDVEDMVFSKVEKIQL